MGWIRRVLKNVVIAIVPDVYSNDIQEHIDTFHLWVERINIYQRSTKSTQSDGPVRIIRALLALDAGLKEQRYYRKMWLREDCTQDKALRRRIDNAAAKTLAIVRHEMENVAGFPLEQ